MAIVPAAYSTTLLPEKSVAYISPLLSPKTPKECPPATVPIKAPEVEDVEPAGNSCILPSPASATNILPLPSTYTVPGVATPVLATVVAGVPKVEPDGNFSIRLLP